MKTTLACWAGAVAAGIFLPSISSADITVYQNNTTDLNTRLNAGSAEIGDEVILNGGPGNYMVNGFTFEYYGENFANNTQMEVRFYKNDGSSSTPGTVLWDSGKFGVLQTSRSTLSFTTGTGQGDLPVGGVSVPQDFTWTVQLFNLTGNTHGGVDLYSPPTIGNNYTDYWYNDPVNGWQLRYLTGANNSVVPADFGAVITAVPEPATYLTAGLLVLPFLGLLKRKTTPQA